MTFKTAMKSIMKQYGLTQEDLVKALGLEDRAAVSMAYRRNNPQLQTLVKWTDALGCQVWVVPKQAKVPSGWLLDGVDPEPVKD